MDITLPKFSVIIPAYNEEKYLAACLASLQKQDYPGPIEIIVVDNNSTDNTALVAKKFTPLVFFESQQGIARALIRGIKASTGMFLAFTDADTLVPRYWISEAYRIFSHNSLVVALGGPHYYFDGVKIANFVIKYGGLLYKKLLFKNLQGLTGSNMIVTKTAYTKVGGFNPSLHWGQDTELCKRLSTIGTIYYDLNFSVFTSFRRYSGTHTNIIKKYFSIIKQVVQNGIRFLLFRGLKIPLPPAKPVR